MYDLVWLSKKDQILGQLFLEELVQTNNKNIKGPRYCPFVGESTNDW